MTLSVLWTSLVAVSRLVLGVQWPSDVRVAMCLGFFIPLMISVANDLRPREVWRTPFVGLVAARLAFVWEFRSAYLASPLDVLDNRDGGWSPTAGFVGAWLFALTLQGQMPAAEESAAVSLADRNRALRHRCCLAVGETRYRSGTCRRSASPRSRVKQ